MAEKVANAILYEGYLLYPYRHSALKNRQRWTFGILYPPAYEEVSRGTERSAMHTECLVQAQPDACVRVELRFLHLIARQVAERRADGEMKRAPALVINGQLIETCDEALERSQEFHSSVGAPVQTFPLAFTGSRITEPLWDNSGETVGERSVTQEEIRGTVTVATEVIAHGLWKLTIDVENTSAQAANPRDRYVALMGSLLSAHTILTVTGGNFISLLDPPQEFRQFTSACRNLGNFPVLVGAEGERDTLLCSPILLYDYVQIAPESVGDFYDATEMDEMLTLRVMTLTDAEKAEVRLGDERARSLLERTEQSAREQLARTHGTIRSLRPLESR